MIMHWNPNSGLTEKITFKIFQYAKVTLTPQLCPMFELY